MANFSLFQDSLNEFSVTTTLEILNCTSKNEGKEKHSIDVMNVTKVLSSYLFRHERIAYEE